MRFIENYAFGIGDQFAKTRVFQCHVGKEQVVIYHHNICVHGFFTGFHQITIFVIRAVSAQTVVYSRGH